MDDPTLPADDNPCVICRFAKGWIALNDPTAQTLLVRAKAIDNIAKVSEQLRQDGLHSCIQDEVELTVHTKCKLKYIKIDAGVDFDTRKRKYRSPSQPSTSDADDDSVDTASNVDESSTSEFDFQNNCVVCTKKIKYVKSKRNKNYFSTTVKERVIRYLNNDDKLDKSLCKSIIFDLENVPDLNVEFHAKCRQKLYPDRNTYEKCSKSNDIQVSIQAVIDFVDENSGKFFNIEDFLNMLTEKKLFQPSTPTIWKKLKEHYGDRLILLSCQGRKTRLCLSETGYELIENALKQATDLTDEKIVEKSAKIILNDVDKVKCFTDKKMYPASDKMFDNITKIPATLQTFLQKVIVNDHKKKN